MKSPNGLVLTVYANDGHIESRRTFKRLSSEEAKEVKSGYDWDYEYALKHYNSGIMGIISSGVEPLTDQVPLYYRRIIA